MPGWLNRYARIALMLALMLPAFHQPAKGQAPGHVVIHWTSPTYGFSISYRRDSFVFVNQSTAETGDMLTLSSSAGSATVEAMPAGQTVDSCAAVALEKWAFAAEASTIIEPVTGGTGVIEVTTADGDTITHRVDCTLSGDETYLIRYSHSAESDRYGRFASAARAIRESYLPGYPANSDLPPEITHPDGLVDVLFHSIEPTIAPPADSNLVNHPTRFFSVEIAFSSLLPVDALIDGKRISIPGIGPAMSYTWLAGLGEYDTPYLRLKNRASAIGRFVFAVPLGTATVTLCYQHLNGNDCTWLFDYSFNAQPESAVTAPPLPVVIDPGR
jgi:hypothetical protein